MSSKRDWVHTERGFDRLVNFTDAVVAIAATLLILPLITRLSRAYSDGGDPEKLLSWDTFTSIAGFVLTFWVMTIFWRVHHGVFERLKGYSERLMTLTFFWLASIIFLSFPAGIISLSDLNLVEENYAAALYFATTAVVSGLGTAIGIYASRHPELLRDPNDEANRPSYRPFVFAALWAILALVAMVPAVGFHAFWGLVLYPIVIIAVRSSDRVQRHTERGLDRLVSFSDAVVAIAITLLILPLIEILSDGVNDVSELKLDRLLVAKVLAFGFTFWMMSRQWLVNHRTYEQLKDYSQQLITLTLLWLLAMVFLAFPAGIFGEWMVAANPSEGPPITRFAPLFYWSALAVISLLGSAIQFHASRHSEILADPARPIWNRIVLLYPVLYLSVGVLSTRFGPWGLLPLPLLFVVKRRGG
ncbi:MAG: DUF1211 domain-containing protein [Actinomycetia bacterium]|nr:DUF1211 domain-containing protein [Actinomycetes bacterium]